jgi:hypothetical protein
MTKETKDLYPHLGRLQRAIDHAQLVYDELRRAEMSTRLAREGVLDPETAQKINDLRIEQVNRGIELIQGYLKKDKEEDK